MSNDRECSLQEVVDKQAEYIGRLRSVLECIYPHIRRWGGARWCDMIRDVIEKGAKKL